MFPSYKWNEDENAFFGLKDKVIRIILHFAYGQCLPKEIRHEDIDECNEATKNLEGFEDFMEKGKLYKEKSALCTSEIH